MNATDRLLEIIDSESDETQKKLDQALGYAIVCVRKVSEIEEVLENNTDSAAMLDKIREIMNMRRYGNA